MSYQYRFDELLQRSMTRRDFLRNLGLFFMSIVGLSTVINIFFSSDTKQQSLLSRRWRGFGEGRYGP